jgi:hypothetical protein
LTGGSLNTGVITKNDGPGTATINATSNMVNVTWDDGGLKVNGLVDFKMNTDFGAEFAGGNWTDKNGGIIGPAFLVPEPSGRTVES